VSNGNFLAATRLLYAMGGRDLLGRRLAAVHPEYQTPATAILLVGLLSALAVFLGQAILIPITEVGSFTCAIGWLSTCLAFCGGAGGKVRPLDLIIGLGGTVVAGAFLVIVAYGFGHYEWYALAAWAALGAGLWLSRPSRRSVYTTGLN
jgi:amino acid transporter